VTPIIASLSRMRGTAAADSALLTVIRTSSEPARQSSATCLVVASTSAGVGIGHRLHDDRRIAAHLHPADDDLSGRAARLGAEWVWA
jgi:hypothetical protein